MEVGPHQDFTCIQCVSHYFNLNAVITWYSQTELAINTHATVSGTHTVVSNTHTVVSDTHTVVSNTHTMVSDLHRTIVHGQEGNDGKLPVSGICTQPRLNAD